MISPSLVAGTMGFVGWDLGARKFGKGRGLLAGIDWFESGGCRLTSWASRQVLAGLGVA